MKRLVVILCSWGLTVLAADKAAPTPNGLLPPEKEPSPLAVVVPKGIENLPVAPSTALDGFGFRSEGELLVKKKDVSRSQEAVAPDLDLQIRARLEAGLKGLPIYGVSAPSYCIIGRHIIRANENFVLQAEKDYPVKVLKVEPEQITFLIEPYGEFTVPWKARRIIPAQKGNTPESVQKAQEKYLLRTFTAPPLSDPKDSKKK